MTMRTIFLPYDDTMFMFEVCNSLISLQFSVWVAIRLGILQAATWAVTESRRGYFELYTLPNLYMFAHLSEKDPHISSVGGFKYVKRASIILTIIILPPTRSCCSQQQQNPEEPEGEYKNKDAIRKMKHAQQQMPYKTDSRNQIK